MCNIQDTKKQGKAKKENAEILQKKYARRGVVYLSRIPPKMKPARLKALLSVWGTITRIYLAPEDPALRRKRKKVGGNKGKLFTEGWVEFDREKDAKNAALMLNGENIGGNKRSPWYHDIWNIKYLKSFQWDLLTEEVAAHQAEKEVRLQHELREVKRERDFYLKQVSKAKKSEAIMARRNEKAYEGASAESPSPQTEQQSSAMRPEAVEPGGSQRPGGVKKTKGSKGKRDSGFDGVKGGVTKRQHAGKVANSAGGLQQDVLQMLMGL